MLMGDAGAAATDTRRLTPGAGAQPAGGGAERSVTGMRCDCGGFPIAGAVFLGFKGDCATALVCARCALAFESVCRAARLEAKGWFWRVEWTAPVVRLSRGA